MVQQLCESKPVLTTKQSNQTSIMCRELWQKWRGCGHLEFKSYYACDDWSESHPGANEVGSEDCPNYVAGAVHATEDVEGNCAECNITPPDSD